MATNTLWVCFRPKASSVPQCGWPACAGRDVTLTRRGRRSASVGYHLTRDFRLARAYARMLLNLEHGAHLQHSRAAQPAVSCSCVWRAEWSTGVELSATTISFACELLHSASPSSVACLMRPAERKAPQGHSNIQVRLMRGWPACLPYRRRLPRSRKAEPSTLTILFARRCSNETGPKSWQIDICGSGNDDDMRPAAFVALRSISGEGPT